LIAFGLVRVAGFVRRVLGANAADPAEAVGAAVAQSGCRG
jgi:hypothetical protein